MKEYNVIVTGVGGLGAMTLGTVIAQAALKQGYDVRTSELHGLAQRGGSMLLHLRIGKKLYTPLVLEGEANLVIALEPLEALRTVYFGSKKQKTTFLIDNFIMPTMSNSVMGEKYPSMNSVIKRIKPFSGKVIVIDAAKTVEKEFGSVIASNVFVFGYAIGKKLLPIKKKYAIEALKQVVPPKFLEMNLKIFEMGFKHK